MGARDEVGCYLAGPDGRTCYLGCNDVRSGHIRYRTRSLQPPGKPGRVSRAPGKQPAAATSSSSLRRDHRIRRVPSTRQDTRYSTPGVRLSVLLDVFHCASVRTSLTAYRCSAAGYKIKITRRLCRFLRDG
jgi:hypothetical protein